MKKLFKILLSIAIIISLLAAGLFIGVAINNKTISVGRVLFNNSDHPIFLLNDMPISLSRGTENQKMFSGLTDGDLILVIHGEVMTSYPAQTTAMSVVKLKDGIVDDIDAAVIDGLVDMGWYSREAVDNSNDTSDITETLPMNTEGVGENTEIETGSPTTEMELEMFSVEVVGTNCIGSNDLLPLVVNAEDLQIDGANLPLIKFNSFDEINQFADTFNEVLAIDQENGLATFADVMGNMNPSHLNSNVVFAIYAETLANQSKYDVYNVTTDGHTLLICVDQIQNERSVTNTVAGRLLIVSVSRDLVEQCDSYNAQLLVCVG